MSLQGQKVIPDIFSRCFLVEKLAQTLLDDRSRRKNGLKDFLIAILIFFLYNLISGNKINPYRR